MRKTYGLYMYIYIRVDEVDAEYSRLETIGLTPSMKSRDWEWGNSEFIVKDPDGYKLCFWQPVSS